MRGWIEPLVPIALSIALAAFLPRGAAGAWVAPATVDRVDLRGFVFTGGPELNFSVLTRSTRYHLSDGRQWTSNYTLHSDAGGWLDHVEVTPDSVRYVIATGPSLWSETATYGDYSAGPIMSSAGTFGGTGLLTLVAAKGSTTASMHGQVRVTRNDRLWSSVWGEPPFAYFSSIRGSVVPFQLTYTIYGTTWNEQTFESNFQYIQTGSIDLAHPVSVPALEALDVRGSGHVPDGVTVQYHAVARYANGVERDVTHLAQWSLDPGSPATQSGGEVTVPVLAGTFATLTIRASYSERGVTCAGARSVLAERGLPLAPPGAWPQFQADARHSGYQPIVLDPRGASLLWSRTLDARYTVQPVAAANGLVFATLRTTNLADVPQLFALRGATGEVLWSRGFGPVSSVNPPSYAFGNLYLQTGKPSGPNVDAALHALDARTGEPAFRTIHGAQWEVYGAPAIAGRTACVNAGYVGGMDAFDALSGERLWHQGALLQVDGWTPALDDRRAYAFLGSPFESALYAVDQASGAMAYAVPDTAARSRFEAGPVLGELGEALVVNRGRLLCYDRATGALRWKIARAFAERPAVARGTIYVIDDGALAAIDEASQADRWNWRPPEGSLTGPLVVTDSHVLATTSANTYAVGLASHSTEWTYPFVGSLAVADGVLYIAGAKGVLRAIRMVDSPTAVLLEDFRGERDARGVALSWVLGDAEAGARVTVERAPAATGPWTALGLDVRRSGDRWTAHDSDADPAVELWYRLAFAGDDGEAGASAPVHVPAGTARARPHLAIVSANPTNGPVRLGVSLPCAARVRVRVFDPLGRTVATLADGTLPAGENEMAWSVGGGLRAGLYLVTLDADGRRSTVRVALVR